MAKRLRHDANGKWQHIVNRGARHGDIFYQKRDREFFLGLLYELPDKYGIETLAFCLLNNHFHLVLHCPKGNLSKGIKWLAGYYALKFNFWYGFDGSPFRGRFKSKHIDTERYLLNAVRYVHQNPLSHGFVTSLNHFEWSSHQNYLDPDHDSGWLNPKPVFQLLEQKGESYSSFIKGPIEKLKEELEPTIEKVFIPINVVESIILEVTKSPRSDFFHSSIGVKNNTRILLFYFARISSGLSDKQIAHRYHIKSNEKVKSSRSRLSARLQDDLVLQELFKTIQTLLHLTPGV